MRILFKEPGKQPRTMVVPNELGVLQQLVDGYIETLTWTDRAVWIFNEEGRIRNMEPNCYSPRAGEIIYGPLIVAGVDGDEFTDIPDDYIEFTKWALTG